MKIKIDDITGEGLSLDITEEPGAFEPLMRGFDFSIPSQVSAHLNLVREAGGIFIAGDVSSPITASCSRCLKKFTFEVKAHFSKYLVEKGREKEEYPEKELIKKEMDTGYFQGTELDTRDILLEEIFLEVPMKPLCKETCKGFCPRCGADLNAAACGCAKVEKLDPRFAKLKDFKLK